MTQDQAGADPLITALRTLGLDSVEGAFAFGGGTDLDRPGLMHRRRTRFTVTDETGREHTLYLKRYGPEPLMWRVRRLATYGAGRSPAAIEFDNIRAARAAGLPTMRELVCGQDEGRGGAGRSYLVVTAVPGEPLAACGPEFLAAHAPEGEAVARLTSGLAGLVGRLHRGGYVHRDLYTTHIFLDARDGRVDLHLIDLARMFTPRWRKFRWRVKDLAQLRFSMPPEWVARQWDTFLRQYLEVAPSARAGRLNAAVRRKAERIRREVRRRGHRRR